MAPPAAAQTTASGPTVKVEHTDAEPELVTARDHLQAGFS